MAKSKTPKKSGPVASPSKKKNTKKSEENRYFTDEKKVEKRDEPMEAEDVADNTEETETIKIVKDGKKLSPEEKKKIYLGNSGERAIVYITHLPHGFYEKQLHQFLSQFGTITNLRVGRSDKTGNSKGYAFVEFKFPEVAKIVAETMNNYLMFDRIVKCQVVDPVRAKKGRKGFFSKYRVVKDRPPGVLKRRVAKKQVNKVRTDEEDSKRSARLGKKLLKLKEKLAAAVVEVDFSEELLKTKNDAKPKQKTPVMVVDSEDEDITLKTPPNVKKMKTGKKEFSPETMAKLNKNLDKLIPSKSGKLSKSASTNNTPVKKDKAKTKSPSSLQKATNNKKRKSMGN